MTRAAAIRAPARIARRKGLGVDIHTHVAPPDALAKSGTPDASARLFGNA